MHRRDFLKASVIATAGTLLENQAHTQTASGNEIFIRLEAPSSAKTRLAVTELISGLHQLNPAWNPRESNDIPDRGLEVILTIRIETSVASEDYEIAVTERGVTFNAASEQGL